MLLQGKELIERLERLFRQVDKYRGCYFWGGDNGNSSHRSWLEDQNNVAEFEWTEGGKHYTARFDTDYRRNYVMAHGTYTRDGNYTNLTAIKNSYKRLKADMSFVAMEEEYDAVEREKVENLHKQGIFEDIIDDEERIYMQLEHDAYTDMIEIGAVSRKKSYNPFA